MHCHLNFECLIDWGGINKWINCMDWLGFGTNMWFIFIVAKRGHPGIWWGEKIRTENGQGREEKRLAMFLSAVCCLTDWTEIVFFFSFLFLLKRFSTLINTWFICKKSECEKLALWTMFNSRRRAKWKQKHNFEGTWIAAQSVTGRGVPPPPTPTLEYVVFMF